MTKINFFLLTLAMPYVYATDINCPTEKLVKECKFIHALQNDHDPTCWEFTSSSFQYLGHSWHISFGTFFDHVTEPEMALDKGQKYFAKAALVVKNPVPADIPSGVVCHYMPSGYPYWISAIHRK